MQSYFVEFGFRVKNRKFAVRIPKIKLKTPKILLRRKYKNISEEVYEDVHLKELSGLYCEYLTLRSNAKCALNSFDYDVNHEVSKTKSESESRNCNSMSISDDDSNMKEMDLSLIDLNNENGAACCDWNVYENYENGELKCSTPVTTEIMGEMKSEKRKVIVLNDASDIKIYEDLSTDYSREVLVSFLNQSGETLYEHMESCESVSD